MRNLWIMVAVLLMTACTTLPPPRHIDNLCSIFKQYPHWQRATKDVERRWHLPVTVQMAIMYQESKFEGDARPPRTKLLWVIPWKRPSTAYGYSQALNGTWAQYKRARGGVFASRSDFEDGVDFMGWYANEAYKRAHISRADAYSLYLAYHEGVGGYLQRSYLRKPWLIAVAHKVSRKNKIYQVQLASCRSHRRSFWSRY